MSTGFVGGGNMAEALIKGMTAAGHKDIMVSEPREERRKYLEDNFGIVTTPDNREVIENCRLVILAVKPQMMAEVLEELAPAIGEGHTVVSIAAGLPISFFESRLKTRKLVRVMPNVGAFAGEGMCVLSLSECFDDQEVAAVRDIFMGVGKVLTLPEEKMNAVTALSGSGPAFIALFIEHLAEAAVAEGLSEAEAETLASQTLIGTAALIKEGRPAADLRKAVTSPGGTTEAGLKSFEENGLKDLARSAVKAAINRARELSENS